jgi:hypothetical protein
MYSHLKPILEASYQKSKVAKNTLEKHGHKLDRELSNKEAKTFIDAEGNPSIVVRGSKSAYDWLVSDPLLAIGKSHLDPRKRRTNELIEKVKNKYGTENVNIYGHSLAGSLISNAKTGGHITTYNKGSGLGSIGKTINPNQLDIRTGRDIVSLLSKTETGGKKVEIKGSDNPLVAHSINELK